MIRETQSQDIPALKVVLDETGLFPGDMLPDLIAPFLSDEESGDVWLTCESDGQPVGFCYAVPEELADGAWNMLALAVRPGTQGNGLGAALVAELEDKLRQNGQRILIADTSGTAEYKKTRAFYRNNGYTEEARIRDFWGPNDDKVVFWKSLATQ